MNIITLSRKELCCALGVTAEALKLHTKRGTEERYLLDKGYKVINKYKVGRECVYDLERASKTEWENLTKELRVNCSKFTLHTIARWEYNKKKEHTPVDKICVKTGISKNTSYKYDKLLWRRKFMNKDYIYIRHIKDKDPIEVTVKEYNNFWTKHTMEEDIRKGIIKDCEEGKITPKRMGKLLDNVTVKLFNREGVIVTKLPVYTEGEEGYHMYQLMLKYLNLQSNE